VTARLLLESHAGFKVVAEAANGRETERAASHPRYGPCGGLPASLVNLGLALCSERKRREAVDAYEQALALNRRLLGSKHIRTLSNMNLLGCVSPMLSDSDRAAALFAEALPVERELYPNGAELWQASPRCACGKEDPRRPCL
jgi:tetratricopeptide (TPR) repeat protein